MGPEDAWRVNRVRREEFATGGLVTAPSAIVVGAFGCDYIIPARLAKIIGNPFSEEEDVD